VEDLSSKVALVNSGCEEVVISSKFKNFLQFVLHVVKHLDFSKVNSGFSLPSLSKLESTKSFDGKTNLLDFVEKSLGDNVDFVSSMGSVLKASRVNLRKVMWERKCHISSIRWFGEGI
jgi:hypothetical protein